MDDKISRVKILRRFLFPSLQFRDFFLQSQKHEIEDSQSFRTDTIRYLLMSCLLSKFH